MFLEKLQKVPTAAEMSLWDKAAIAFGIPETMLMENAGKQAALACEEKFGAFQDRAVCLFMGSGNNGGDAACLARHIQDGGGQALVLCMREPALLHGSSAWHASLAQADGVQFRKFDPEKDFGAFLAMMLAEMGKLPGLVVDGLLGTGFKGVLKPDMEKAINFINKLAARLQVPIVAIDIPSGLDSLTGSPSPTAVKAALTVTLAAPKPGLLETGAKEWTGALDCRAIGIPEAVLAKCQAKMRMLEGASLVYGPSLPANSYKNIYGHIFVFGGAAGYAGAGHLACAGALRAGCGLVTACAPENSLADIRAGWPEIMTYPAGPGSSWPRQLSEDLVKVVRRASALAIGPGMGRSREGTAFLLDTLALPGRPPAVIDADALALISLNPAIMRHVGRNDIITPHPGEAALLLGCKGKDVQADRFAALDRLCQLTDAVVILKGASTLIGQGGDARLICPYDIPQLAIGGAGDVLAGCVAAVCGSAQFAGFSPLGKAGYACLLHAMAGLMGADSYPERGYLASQLADSLALAKEYALASKRPFAGCLPWPS